MPLATLAIAIEQQQWEMAALCLLLGVTRAAAALPPDAVDGLLELLEAGPKRPQEGPLQPRGSRRGRCR